jgi:hypothetical protein
MNEKRAITLMRGISALAIFLPMLWIAWAYTPVPLLITLGITASLVSIRIGQAGEARYGRRVQVTEMLPLGRKGDKQMLIGGIAGYLMIVFFGLAAWLAFHD